MALFDTNMDESRWPTARERTGGGSWSVRVRGDDRKVARALATAGLLALASLPALALASFLSATPLAGPSVIALGYLGVAQALRAGRARRAAAWMLAVLAGLVCWPALAFAAVEPPSSALAAALLAPLLGAAPAAAGKILAMRRSPIRKRPAEDMPIAPRVAAETVRPHAASPQADASPCSDPPGLPTAAGAAADVQDAIAFAVRRLGPKARAAGIWLVCSGESTLFASCDRQLCRRIAVMQLDAVLARAAPGERVAITARAVRGAVLMRMTAAGEGRGMDPDTGANVIAAVASLADQAGGSAVAEAGPDSFGVSVRLALPRGQ